MNGNSSASSDNGLLIGELRGEDSSPVILPLETLRRHAAMLGTNGSGKTVMAKILIEEAVLQGIPVFVVDPQGDLARLALHGDNKKIASQGGDTKRAKSWRDTAEVRIWTPTRSKGLPICLDPFQPPTGDLDAEQRVASWDMMAAGLAGLCDHDIEKPEGRQVKAFLYELLITATRLGRLPRNFPALAALVENPEILGEDPDLLVGSEVTLEMLKELSEGFVRRPVRLELSRRLKARDTGTDKLLFSLGVPMDIETMLEPCTSGKVPVNVLYLNTLGTDELRHSFVQEFGRRLYDWMLSNSPEGDEVRLLFFMDEVAPYLPSDPRRPPAKEIIKRLFKEGRKYGVSCILATQNVSDVDYKILAQANTLFIGRFTQKQDRNKVRDLLKVGGTDTEFVDDLPKLKAGEFQLFCPDVSNEPIPLKTRWLYSDHGSPLDEDAVEDLVSDKLRKWAKSKAVDSGRVALPPALPSPGATRPGVGWVDDDPDRPFEVHLMGGLALLRDRRDPLSVMLGVTNLLTSVVLLLTTYWLIAAWMADGSGGWAVLLGALLSLVAASAISLEILAGEDAMLVHRLRQRARPIQYGLVIWVWVLWSGTLSGLFPLEELLIPIQAAQTATTLFVMLEFYHRFKLGRLSLAKEDSIFATLLGGITSLTAMITESEFEVMTASERDLMRTLRGAVDLFTLGFIGIMLYQVVDTTPPPWVSEVLVRLGTIYLLLFTSTMMVQRNE